MSSVWTEGTMRAMRLVEPRAISRRPLHLVEVPIPRPGPGEVLIKVHACGVCHTDLHTVEGDLEPHRESVIPGHQIVGEIVGFGDWPGGDRPDYPAADGRPLQLGERVGVPWLWRACGRCRFCRRGQENLCEQALFTGWDVDGGYAEYHVAAADFIYRLPQEMDHLAVAPLLCAGIIGYRCLRLTGVVGKGVRLPAHVPADQGSPSGRIQGDGPDTQGMPATERLHPDHRPQGGVGPVEVFDAARALGATSAPERGGPVGRLGLYGFGAAAHICLQIAVWRGWEVYVFTRSEGHRELARRLGAVWAGGAGDAPGAPPASHVTRETRRGQLSLVESNARAIDRAPADIALDAAIIFAPVGELALEALRDVDKGGIVALGGIYSSPIPPLDYGLIYDERVLRSVANSTRADALELLRDAAAVPVRTEVETFPLEDANEALAALKESRIQGAAVLDLSR